MECLIISNKTTHFSLIFLLLVISLTSSSVLLSSLSTTWPGKSAQKDEQNLQKISSSSESEESKENPSRDDDVFDHDDDNMFARNNLQQSSFNRSTLSLRECILSCKSNHNGLSWSMADCSRLVEVCDPFEGRKCNCQCWRCVAGLGGKCNTSMFFACEENLVCRPTSRNKASGLGVCATLDIIKSDQLVIEDTTKSGYETPLGLGITWALIIISFIIFFTAAVYMLKVICRTACSSSEGQAGTAETGIQLSQATLRLLGDQQLRHLGDEQLFGRVSRTLEESGMLRRDSFVKWLERQVVLEHLGRMIRTNQANELEHQRELAVLDSSSMTPRRELMSWRATDDPASHGTREARIDPNDYMTDTDLAEMIREITSSQQENPPSYSETVAQISRPPSYNDISTSTTTEL